MKKTSKQVASGVPLPQARVENSSMLFVMTTFLEVAVSGRISRGPSFYHAVGTSGNLASFAHFAECGPFSSAAVAGQARGTWVRGANGSGLLALE